MTFPKSYILLLCSAAALLTSCDIYEQVPLFERVEKTPIALSLGGADGSVASRAVVTDGTDKNLQPFDVATKIFMVMKSEYEDATGDFKGNHTTKYTVSRGDVAAAQAGVTGHDITFDDDNRKYWDDAHARSSKLSIWAYAQKGAGWTTCTFNGEERNTTSFFPWRQEEIVPVINTWKASHYTSNAQDANSVMYQDLLFSNNLVNNTDKGKADGRLKFDFTARKFPQGNDSKLIFYHAMAKFTINIVMGDGFTADEFKFTPATSNVSLNGFNNRGTFDFRVGEFTATTVGAIPSISQVGGFADNKYTLEALVVPGTNLYSSAVADAFVFTLNNNMYKVSAKTLAEAIRSWTDPETHTAPYPGFTTIEAGKHYFFTFIVGKKKIEHLTAAVADWEVVSAEDLYPTNARIKLRLEERDGTGIAREVTSGVKFYTTSDDIPDAAPIDDNYATYNWTQGYSILPSTYSSDKWVSDPTVYWQSNKNLLHFRALMGHDGDISTGTVGTFANVSHIPLSSGNTFTDVCWGAPMLDVADNTTSDHTTLKWCYGPTLRGFDGKDNGDVASALPSGTQHQIYKAIGPTEDAIKLTLFHMMSDLTFKITTTTDADEVDLGNGSTSMPIVEILDAFGTAQLLLGNGLVVPSGSKTDAASIAKTDYIAKTDTPTPAPALYTFHYGIVPQSLEGIKLRITTPDSNRYIVDLKDVLATSVSTTNLANPYTANKIDRWYPGYKYQYNLVLKKKGQVDFKATIVEWEEVVVDNENVQIK